MLMPPQDTEDFPFIQYTVVVKLTPDLPGESPSQAIVIVWSVSPRLPLARGCVKYRV